MLKILYFTEQWVNGGVAAFIMNVSRILLSRHDNLNITLLVGEDISNFYDDELQQLGIKKYVLLGNSRMNPIRRHLNLSRKLNTFLQVMTFDVCHIHICNSLGLEYASIIMEKEIYTIVHAHNSSNSNSGIIKMCKNLINFFYKQKFKNAANIYLACSDLAALYVYNNTVYKNCIYIKNAIDTNRFHFNEDARKEIRKSLQIDENDIIVCHIGRFIKQKNHKYIHKIIGELAPTNAKYLFLLIGEGPLLKQTENYLKKNNLLKRVVILSNIVNIQDYLSASDVFILPSLFEGLPIVAIEAQASGLPVLMSDTITKMAKITNNVYFFDIKKDTEMWTKKIESIVPLNFEKRKRMSTFLKERGYDTVSVAEQLHALYNMV